MAAAAPPAEPAVRTSEERLEGGRVRLSVTIPVAVCQAGYKRVLDVYRKQANVQGYRKGKAPTDVLISHLGGQAAVNNSVLSELLGPAMAQALAPYQAEVIADSEAIEEGGEALGAAFDPAADFTFHVCFDTMPAVAWRTPYKELAVEAETPSSPAADAAAVEAKLRTLRKAGAALRIVADRGLQRGDVAVVDVAASDAASGAPLPGTSREGMRLDTDDADETFLPGIVAAMEGLRAGEERTSTLTFPSSEEFQPAALRGVEARVTVKLSELFEQELPELTDEWAESLEAGIGGVAGLRRRLEQNQAAESADARERALVDALTGAVAAAVDCPHVPASLVEEAGRQRYSAKLAELMGSGMSREVVEKLLDPALVRQYADRKWDELVELQRAVLGFEDILAKEELHPSAAEVEEELALAAEQHRASGFGEYDEGALREKVVETLETQKVMQWLKENVKVTHKPYAG